MKKIPELDTVMFNSIFSGSVMFYGSFRIENNLICQKNTLWKVDKIVSKSNVLRKVAGNTER